MDALISDVGTAASDITHSTSSDAFKITAGWRFLPFLALEADYLNLGAPHDSLTGTGSDGTYRRHLTGFPPIAVGLLRPDICITTPTCGSSSTNLAGSSLNPTTPGQTSLMAVALDHTAGHLKINAEYDQIRITNAHNSNALWLGAAWRF